MRKRTFGDLPFQLKMNIIFLTVVILPVFLMSLIISEAMGRQLQREGQKNAVQYLEQGTENLELSFQELDELVYATLYSDEVQAILTNADREHVQRENQEYLMTSLRTIKNMRKEIVAIWIEDKTGRIYSLEPTQVTKPDMSLEISGKRGQMHWRREKNEKRIIGFRYIYDVQTLEEIGKCWISVDETAVCDIYDDLKVSEGSCFVVLDCENQLISTNGEDIAEPRELCEKISQYDADKLLHDGVKYYVNERDSEYLEWSIFYLTPVHEMLKNVEFVRRLLIAICMIVVGIMLITAKKLTDYITKPVNKLIALTKAVQIGNFEVQAEIKNEDEFGLLSRSFNAMVIRIKYLIEEVYKKELMIKDTEYKYLQAQINPHFLYNTLDSISWLANMAGVRDVSRMSVALGKIMRWAISNNQSVVMLEEELQNLEAYMTIQRIRYSDRIKDTIDIPEELRGFYVPKMILQPMVENAIIHGLEGKTEEGNIYIIARKMGQKLCVTVRDDGVGITEEKLEVIRQDKSEKKSGKKSIGIANVAKRIRMIYGEGYGLEIESIYGEGTAVHMWLGLFQRREDLEKGGAELDV